jgi:hypothetical protein
MSVRDEPRGALRQLKDKGDIRMVRTIKTGLVCAALAATFSVQVPLHAQQYSVQQDEMKHDKMMQKGNAKT